jgi:hypothetical protein
MNVHPIGRMEWHIPLTVFMNMTELCCLDAAYGRAIPHLATEVENGQRQEDRR